MDPTRFLPSSKNIPATLPAGLHRNAQAAESHGSADHLTAHELSRQAHEHSLNAIKLSEQLVKEAEKSAKK